MKFSAAFTRKKSHMDLKLKVSLVQKLCQLRTERSFLKITIIIEDCIVFLWSLQYYTNIIRYHHFVCPLFAAGTVWMQAGIDFISLRMQYQSLASHSFCTTSCSCKIVVIAGIYLRCFCLIICHIFLIGLRSGDTRGQGSCSICKSLCFIHVLMAACCY